MDRQMQVGDTVAIISDNIKPADEGKTFEVKAMSGDMALIWWQYGKKKQKPFWILKSELMIMRGKQ